MVTTTTMMIMTMTITIDNDESGDDVSRAVLQAPFNTVQYSIIGDDSSPAFFTINPTTGTIILSQSVAGDPTDRYNVSCRHPSCL